MTSRDMDLRYRMGISTTSFLRCLSERYDTIVTLLVKSNVKTATPTQILGEILTHDMVKKSQDEAHGGEIDMKKKSVAFKAQDSKNEEESGCQEEESDEEMALFVKRFNRMMSKKSFGKRGQSSRKNPFVDKTCFNCGKKFGMEDAKPIKTPMATNGHL